MRVSRGPVLAHMKRLATIACLISLVGVVPGFLFAAPCAHAQTAAPPYPRTSQSLIPDRRHMCLDFLEMEKLQVDEDGSVQYDMSNPASIKLMTDFFTWKGWLQGYFTSRNQFDLTTDGNVTEELSQSNG
jgi:hypothetical protein